MMLCHKFCFTLLYFYFAANEILITGDKVAVEEVIFEAIDSKLV